MVTVPVIKAFTHEGRDYRAGQSFEADPLAVAVLARRGFLSLTSHTSKPSKPGQSYRTRRLTARD